MADYDCATAMFPWFRAEMLYQLNELLLNWHDFAESLRNRHYWDRKFSNFYWWFHDQIEERVWKMGGDNVSLKGRSVIGSKNLHIMCGWNKWQE